MKIATIPIDDKTIADVLSQVRVFLAEERFHHIVTINPEFIVRARRNAAFRDAICAADLRIADGIGISIVARLQGEKACARIPGIDLMRNILDIASTDHLRIFLVANSGGLSGWEKTRDAISEEYPMLEINGMDIDPYDDESWSAVGKYVAADIIFCNFGAPQQEIFLRRLKDARIRLGIGVGGSFDYMTGALKRAPQWMRVIGMEWLFRLIQQPRRWRRIFNAIILFPLIVIFKR